ncbi:T9SS type A sorting domain-containing protein [Chryseobacterium cucumeris]
MTMKLFNYQKLFFYLLIFNCFFYVKAQNLQLTNLFQAHPTTPSYSVTSNYLKAQANGDIYSNVVASGSVNIFGNQINTGANKASVFSKLNSAGSLQWQAYISSFDIQSASYYNSNCIDQNAQGEIIYAIRTLGNSNFKSNSGLNIPLINNGHEIIKISDTGELLWKKSINSPTPKVFCFYDRNGDVIVWLGQNGGTDLLFDNQPYNEVKSFIAKLDGQTGNLIYLKKYDNLDPWTGNIAFDENNNLYAFYEPFNPAPNNIFNIGNIQINGNSDQFNFFMIKFDTSGNPIFGKNFYESLPAGIEKYSWANHVRYDGNNFLIYEVLASASNPNLSFLTIDGIYHPNPYQNKYIANAISKVSKTGAVLSSVPIFTSGTYDSNSFDIDTTGNGYIYGRWSDKVTIENTEYQMNNYSSNIIKFNSNGTLSYIEPIVNNTFSDLNQKISVLPGNKILISGNTSAQSIKGQPLSNTSNKDYYIAELVPSGTLSIKESTKDTHLKIYPNPVYNFIGIEGNNKSSFAKIYDLSGKLIMSTVISSNRIEAVTLPTGNYILEIFDHANKLIEIKKFIKK